MRINDDDIITAKETSIVDYLTSCGYNLEKNGGRHYCQSPFSYDRTPSFCIYNTNTFYDWANGFGGDIIKLVMEIENITFTEAVRLIVDGEFPRHEVQEIETTDSKVVDVNRFLRVTDSEYRDICSYAMNRGITRNFNPSAFSIRDGEEYVRRPSVGYVHVDEEFNVCGIKMRDINPYKDKRFSARGKQKFYVITNCEYDKLSSLYIVESESSANSLFEYLCIIGKSCSVVSFGSWSNVPKDLPPTLNPLDKRSVIIDYDGNEELYQERIAQFDHLNAREIKLELPKNEDINSLFVSGLLHKYKNLFI